MDIDQAEIAGLVTDVSMSQAPCLPPVQYYMSRLSPSDRKALLTLHHEWRRAEQRGRCRDVLTLCTTDAAWMAPGGRVFGTEAARLLYGRRTLEVVDVKTSDIRIAGGGRLAVMTCNSWVHYRNVYTGLERASVGRHAWTLRKDDGLWRVMGVTWETE